jgi:hypothetical protein
MPVQIVIVTLDLWYHSCNSCGCDLCCACGDPKGDEWQCYDCNDTCSTCGTNRCDPDDPYECEHPNEVHTDIEQHYVCACCGTTTADFGSDLWG